MKYKEYYKQLSIVILGILIAFWLNNLGNMYKESNTQKQILNIILNELTENNKNLQLISSNLDSLHAIFSQMEPEGNNFFLEYRGLDLKNAGYETAKYIGVFKDLNYTILSKIVYVYDTHNTLLDLEKLLLSEFFSLVKLKTYDEDVWKTMYFHIDILRTNLQSYEIKQQQLIEDLTAYLK